MNAISTTTSTPNDDLMRATRSRNARRAMSPMYFRGLPASFWQDALSRRKGHGK